MGEDIKYTCEYFDKLEAEVLDEPKTKKKKSKKDMTEGDDDQPHVFDGPIPGANFTSDERNWPWHRAPDITDTDEALETILLPSLQKPAEVFDI